MTDEHHWHEYQRTEDSIEPRTRTRAGPGTNTSGPAAEGLFPRDRGDQVRERAVTWSRRLPFACRAPFVLVFPMKRKRTHTHTHTQYTRIYHS